MKIQPDKIEYGGYRIAAYSTSNAITSIGYDIFLSFSRLIESNSVLVQTAIGHSLDEWHYVGDLNRDEFESAYRKNNGFILLGDSSSSVALTVNNVSQPCPSNQSSIVLSLAPSAMATAAPTSKYVDWLKELSTLLDINYAMGYEVDKEKFSFAISHRNGLAAGIYDIFLLNYFGRPYVDSIGIDRLLAMPVGEVSNIDDSAVVVSLVQDLANIDWEKCCNDRLKMRSAIGEEFFVPISAAGSASGVEVLGFFRGMYKLIQSEVSRAIQPNASVPPNY